MKNEIIYEERSWMIPNFLFLLRNSTGWKYISRLLRPMSIYHLSWNRNDFRGQFWVVDERFAVCPCRSTYVFMTGVANFCQVPRILQVRKTNFIDFFEVWGCIKQIFECVSNCQRSISHFPQSYIGNIHVLRNHKGGRD